MRVRERGSAAEAGSARALLYKSTPPRQKEKKLGHDWSPVSSNKARGALLPFETTDLRPRSRYTPPSRLVLANLAPLHQQQGVKGRLTYSTAIAVFAEDAGGNVGTSRGTVVGICANKPSPWHVWAYWNYWVTPITPA